MHPVRKILSPILRPAVQWYLRKERTYSYQGTSLKILPGVFHPGLFFSTKFLLSYLENFDLKNKSLLEPGAGSGLISFIAEKKEANVVTSDLSETALEGLQQNREALHSKIQIIRSDVFDQIPDQPFDFIVINPPYYKGDPNEEWQLAWYCGEDFNYFVKLFSVLVKFTHTKSCVMMVLSEDCDIFTIRNIAKQHGWDLKEKLRRRFWWEWNFIFECCRI
jgi:release factor glutamine methyltransferase